MLPKVTTEKPVKKPLSHKIKGSGVITPKEEADVLSEGGGKVIKVHISKNDQIKKGQLLLTYDTTKAEQDIMDAEDQLKKTKLNRELLQEQFITAQQKGEEADIRAAERALRADELEQDIARRKIEAMRKDLEAKRTLKAPFSGKVKTLEAKEGVSMAPGQSVLKLVKTEEGFQFTLTVEEEKADLLEIGEQVKLNLKAMKKKGVEGTITEIKEPDNSDGAGPNPGGNDGEGGAQGAKPKKTVIISLSGQGLQGGEQATVELQKPAAEQGLVIRKELVKKDSTGSYVFVVREAKSALGNTYRAQKAYLMTGEENGDEIIILGGISDQDSIIADSSEPLEDGNRVRVE